MKWQQTFSTPWLRIQDGMLPAMILGAVFIHGMAFYLIQASSPAPGNRAAIEGQINLLDPKKDRALLEWIENHDPAAVAFQTDSPSPAKLFDGKPYQPSYEKVLPQPLPITTDANSVIHQTLFPPGPVPVIRSSDQEAFRAFRLPPTKITVSDSVDIAKASPFQPPRTSTDIPKPAQFLITRSPKTMETACFLLQSSGNDSLDAACRQWLIEQKISLKNQETIGWLRVDWSQEIWAKTKP